MSQITNGPADHPTNPLLPSFKTLKPSSLAAASDKSPRGTFGSSSLVSSIRLPPFQHLLHFIISLLNWIRVWTFRFVDWIVVSLLEIFFSL
ncbi:hypothetical protein MRB53_005360 [Persea americana]|uniref:Uncharacterized protein n=1 Tax=Persea americana TaxID=3435 RepID=A0ACC2MD54_PERAE|nr:hypothetical protein MRB53_005360 [Persea americana]